MTVLEGPLPPEILLSEGEDQLLPLEETDGRLEQRRATTSVASQKEVSVCFDDNTLNVYTTNEG